MDIDMKFTLAAMGVEILDNSKLDGQTVVMSTRHPDPQFNAESAIGNFSAELREQGLNLDLGSGPGGPAPGGFNFR